MNPNILTLPRGCQLFVYFVYVSAQSILRGWEIIAVTRRNERRQSKIKGDNHDAR